MKKSFLLYCDQIEMINELSDEQAGVLLKHIYDYSHTYESDTIKDPVVKIAFMAIKAAMDRDNGKYLSICDRNKTNGMKGGRPKNPKNPVGSLVTQRNPEEPKKADSDSDSDSDNEKDKKKNKQKEKTLVYPDWLNLELWGDFKEHRKQIKRTLTQRAEKMSLKKLKGFMDAGDKQDEIIEQTICQGWVGLYSVKDENKKGSRIVFGPGAKQ